MSVFVDTSGLVAALVATDEAHAAAAEAWERLVRDKEHLVTTNYTISELYAVMQRRTGIGLLQEVTNNILPLIDTHWVDREMHERGVTGYLSARRRDLSFVDHVSFVAMRSLAVTCAFTLDPHFAEQGFEVIPEALPDT